MTLSNDYFLLYHGIFATKIKETQITSTLDEVSLFQRASLILATSRADFDKFTALNSFHKIIKSVADKQIDSLDEMMQLQYSLIDFLVPKLNKETLATLTKAFDYLREEKLLNSDNYAKLVELFDSYTHDIDSTKHSDKKEDNQHNTFSFIESKSDMKELISDLKDIIINPSSLNKLDNVNSYLDNQKFSIGITGVMNAGKSTMLNALLKQDILGTSVVPETANLTILKYNPKPTARVFYWNSAEWGKIETSIEEIPSLAAFIKQTKEVYGEQLDEYVLENSRYDEINPQDLPLYTSAEKSKSRCNLVKYVELGVDLDFLYNNIEIVDTPGLDDPVTQREEITKEYVTKCDLMIHLMNVNQSATQIDVAFIIDSILYQNVTKLLIVISRADSVTKDELDEVIGYTKSSIKTQLKALNKSTQLDYILSSIKFIPISGHMALLHRTGRGEEAMAKGYSLEDTNILKIEQYLTDTLFGKDNQKSELIIKSSKNKLFDIIENQIKNLHFQIVLLSKSKEELAQELKVFNRKKSANKKIISTMQNDIDGYNIDVKNYIDSLDTFLSSQMYDLQNTIKRRVFDDVKYSLERDKKRPAQSRIKTIVETAIKDGIVDVIRDYRYKFSKKSTAIAELCERKYKKLGFDLSHEEKGFDSMAFFKNNFKAGFLTANNEILISKVLSETSKASLKKLNALDDKLGRHIKSEFTFLEESISQKAKGLSTVLIDDFFETLNTPLNTFKQNLVDEEKILETQLKNADMEELNRAALSIKLHKNIKRLETLAKRCQA